MLDLNTIISGGVAASGWPPAAPAGRPQPPVAPQPPAPGDSFTPGQYDRNRAEAAAEAGGTARQEQARRAYARQDQSGRPAPAPNAPLAAEAKPAEGGTPPPSGGGPESAAAEPGAKSAPLKGPTKQNGNPLSEAEKSLIAQLQKIDSAVRAHENAHLAAAGGLAKGGASFAMAHGPDGRSYAVGGEVQIDTSGGATPSETIAKMAMVRAAALAPADPSSQDLKVAAQATVVSSQAAAELGQLRQLPAGGGKTGGAGEGEKAAEPATTPESAMVPESAAKPVAETPGGNGPGNGYEKYAQGGSASSRPGAFNLIV